MEASLGGWPHEFQKARGFFEKKNGANLIPLNPGWFIGILRMAYYNPYITG